MENIFKINPTYKSIKLNNEIKQFFNQEGFIQLTNFFINENLNEIKNIIKKQSFKKIKNINSNYSKLIIQNNFQFEIIQLIEFFKSKDFIKFIENIVNISLQIKEIKLKKMEINSFENEKENQILEDIIEITYDLSDFWDEEFSGLSIYSQNNEDVFYLEPIFNSLTILFRPSSIEKKVNKINKKAKNKNILKIELQLEIYEEENLFE